MTMEACQGRRDSGGAGGEKEDSALEVKAFRLPDEARQPQESLTLTPLP